MNAHARSRGVAGVRRLIREGRELSGRGSVNEAYQKFKQVGFLWSLIGDPVTEDEIGLRIIGLKGMADAAREAGERLCEAKALEALRRICLEEVAPEAKERPAKGKVKRDVEAIAQRVEEMRDRLFQEMARLEEQVRAVLDELDPQIADVERRIAILRTKPDPLRVEIARGGVVAFCQQNAPEPYFLPGCRQPLSVLLAVVEQLVPALQSPGALNWVELAMLDLDVQEDPARCKALLRQTLLALDGVPRSSIWLSVMRICRSQIAACEQASA